MKSVVSSAVIVKDYKYSELTGKTIGAAMEVHKILGNGFQEVIYQRALEKEFRVAGIPFEREFEMPIFYKSDQIGTRRVDFLLERVVSVELKALTNLEDVHLAQAINYLEAYNLEIVCSLTSAPKAFNSSASSVQNLINQYTPIHQNPNHQNPNHRNPNQRNPNQRNQINQLQSTVQTYYL